jgi:hypothetical protein
MESTLRLALRSFEPYAKRYGYDLIVGSGDSGGRGPSWGKVLLLRRLLAGYDEVLWVDSDVLILDSSADIADALPDECFQGLVEQRISEVERAVNCGVWLLRSDPRSTAFLDAVWDHTAEGEPGMWENLQVLDLLGYSTSRPFRPLRETRWLEGTALLDETWNAIGAEAQGRFRHYSAMTNEHRIRAMKVDLLDLDPRGTLDRRATGLLRKWQHRIYLKTRHRADAARYLDRRISGHGEP